MISNYGQGKKEKNKDLLMDASFEATKDVIL